MFRYKFLKMLAAENRNRLRVERTILRDTQNPFSLDDQAFRSYYCLPKCLVLEIIEKIGPSMKDLRRSTAIPHHLQVLAFLSVVVNGGYQKNVGHDFLLALSQTTVSRCLDTVATVIDNVLAPIYIEFPQTPEAGRQVQTAFFTKFGFPGVIGVIDGTHVKIQKPDAAVEHAYYNKRKNAHTKNVQIVCDCDLKILFVFARFGGSVSDSYVLASSHIPSYMEKLQSSGVTSCWLLGDNAYSQKSWLMTPIRKPTSTMHNHYNEVHRKARSSVKRCIAVLKGRFRILGEDQIMRYSPQKSGIIINACAVLHNIMIINGLPLDDVDFDSNDVPEPTHSDETENIALQGGITTRENLIQQHFS